MKKTKSTHTFWLFFPMAVALVLSLFVYGSQSAPAAVGKATAGSLSPPAATVKPGQALADSTRSSDQVSEEAGLQVQETYGKLPLYFIENRGQTDDAVKFIERGRGHTAFFTKDGVVFALRKSGKEDKEAGGAVLELNPIGMSEDAQIVAENRQEGTVNYFLGNDPAKWRTGVPTYSAVVYREAYPGIDIKFYGNNRQMEYDVIVKPGADPSQVSFRYNGAETVAVNEAGDLVITLPDGGEIVQRKPLVYQVIDGKRVVLEGRFKVEAARLAGTIDGLDGGETRQARGIEESSEQPGAHEFQCGFELAAYDKSKKLIIDPVLVYSTYLGGGGYDDGYGIAVDGSGNAYVTGGTYSADFPTQNPLFPKLPGYYDSDAFVTKINPSGTALVYSTYLGGGDGDLVYGIAVDGSGNAYVTGYTHSADFPTQNPLFPNLRGSPDAFVTKINPSGTALVYSTYVGGSSADHGTSIAVDGSGNAYVTGHTRSADFPTQNPLFPNPSGYSDAFVTKINPSGTALVYSTYLGGGDVEYVYGIAVDGSGNAYVTGYTRSSDFPTQNPLFPNLRGYSDAFVTKINPSGTALVYSTYLGGRGLDSGEGIAVDGSGNAYVTGYTNLYEFPTKNPLFPNCGGDGDAFVTKINPSGTALVYSTYLGGSRGEGGYDIAVDGSGNAYVMGGTYSADFPTQNPLFPKLPGYYDYVAFVTKINPSGTALVYSTYLGGQDPDSGEGIAVDGSGNAYVTGGTYLADFPTQNPLFPNYGGNWDAFVTKISDSATFQFGQNSNSGYFAEPVNTALGNYTYDRADLKLAGILNLEFKRAYNSQDSYSGPLGYGWTHSFNLGLSFSGNFVTVKHPDGHEEGYKKNANGSFTRTHGGIYSVLSQNPDSTYTLTDKSQTVRNFSAEGKLTAITDKNGNTLTLAYSDGNLASVTDPGGRTLSFSYDASNRIAMVSDPLGRTLLYAYDASGNLASFTDAMNGVWSYAYDSNHQMTRITNPNGKVLVANVYANARVVSQKNGRGFTTTFEYDTPNLRETTITDPLGNKTVHTHDLKYQLIKETDALGHSISYTYDANGNRTRIADKNGNKTLYSYDSMGNVTRKTDALGKVTAITYDAKNNPLTKVDALGNTTSFAYDLNGNLLSTTDPLGAITSRTYYASGLVSSITDANARKTSFAYDAYGNLAELTDPLNAKKTITNDQAGRKTSETDANGHTTAFTYDANDNLLSVTDPVGNSEIYTYDANNNKLTWKNRNGKTTAYGYDANDNLISETDPLGHQTLYAYDGLNRKVSTTDQLGNITRYALDAVGNVVSVRDPLLRYTYFTYDGNGNRTSLKDPLSNLTTFAYDALNQPVSTTDPLGFVTSRTYDALGRVVSEKDANGNITQYGYDATGRLTQVTEAGGQTTSYTYDSVGNKTKMTNARGKNFSYGYDAANRLIRETDADGKIKRYSYDGVGNLTAVLKPDGAQILYQYDPVNRLSEIVFPTGSPTVFSYDANGNRTGMVDGLGTSSWVYDALDRPTAYANPFGKAVHYGYDAKGNRTEMIYPGNRSVHYGYNKTGRMTSVSDWLGNTTTYTYDAAGRLKSSLNPNGTSATFGYDKSSRVVSLANKKSDLSIINRHSYILDGVGNQTQERRTEPLSPSHSKSSLASTFDGDNRILKTGTRTYTHDANGNRTVQSAPNAANFTYDALDRLVAYSGGDEIGYGYDGLGNRLTRTENGTETRFVLDTAGALPSVIAETNSSGGISSYYIYGMGLAYKISAGKAFVYHYDSRGSTVAISNPTGQIVNKYAYTPFGEIAGMSGRLANPFCFVGKYGIMEEGNGLKFMRARYYDSETGRFLNKDLIPGDSGRPQSLNRFAYAFNNPAMRVDTSGLIPQDIKDAMIHNGVYSSDSEHGILLSSPEQKKRLRMARLRSAAILQAGYYEQQAIWAQSEVEILQVTKGAIDAIGAVMTGGASAIFHPGAIGGLLEMASAMTSSIDYEMASKWLDVTSNIAGAISLIDNASKFGSFVTSEIPNPEAIKGTAKFTVKLIQKNLLYW